jgi:hypothetical protein
MSWTPSYSKVAGGNITPSSFVKLDTSNAGQVLLCGAGENPYGISQPGTRNAPFPSLDDGFAAVITENLMVYGAPAKDVLLRLGAGGALIGSHLKSDASGFGIACTGTTDVYGAIAQEAGASGDLIRVQVVAGTVGFAT